MGCDQLLKKADSSALTVQPKNWFAFVVFCCVWYNLILSSVATRTIMPVKQPWRMWVPFRTNDTYIVITKQSKTKPWKLSNRNHWLHCNDTGKHGSWTWRYQMETFSALLPICMGNSPITGEFPSQRPVTRSFEIFFGLRLNKRLNKQSRVWWYETASRSLWRQCNNDLTDYVLNPGHITC